MDGKEAESSQVRTPSGLVEGVDEEDVEEAVLVA